MPDTAKSNINEQDESVSYSKPSTNISGFIGDFEFGPINDPEILITTPQQLTEIYGGIKQDNSNARCYLQAVMALEMGSALRICNVKSYSDLTDPESLTAQKATPGNVNIYSFSALLSSGKNVVFSLFGGWQTITTAFSVSHTATLDKFIKAIKANYQIMQYISYIVRSGNKLIIIQRYNYGNVEVTVTGTGSAINVTTTTTNAITNSDGEALFSIQPKYAGAKYNDLFVEIKPSSNGSFGAFDLIVTLKNSALESNPEKYINQVIPFGNAYLNNNFLKEVAEKSNLIEVVYLQTDLTNQWNLTPNPMALFFENGSDGSAIVAADIIGNSISKLGIRAFDGYDDISRIGCGLILDTDNDSVSEALAEYADLRKDIFAAIEIPGNSDSAVVTKRNELNINTSYGRFYSGGTGIPVLNPKTKAKEFIGVIGAVLGASAKTASDYGYHYSYAGETRGIVLGAKDAGNKWGADTTEDGALQYLAKNQINTIIKRNGKVMIWGNFTAQRKQSLLSYASIRDNFIGIKKSIKPLMGPFLEELNDIGTWKLIYNGIQPYLKKLKDSRAAMKLPVWEGDQNASSVDDLKINNASDVQQFGKYKAQLRVAPTNSLQDFTINVIATAAGVDFEEREN